MALFACLAATCSSDPHGAITITELHELGQARYGRRTTITGQVLPGSFKRPPAGSRVDLVPLSPDGLVFQLIDDQRRVQPVLLARVDDLQFTQLSTQRQITVTGKVHPTGMFFADGVYIESDLVPVPTPTPGILL